MKAQNFKILYIHPEESKNRPYFLSGILRISNYLNSRKHSLNYNIEEEYLDLRFERLPSFSFKNIHNYRKKLKKLLFKTYDDFNFNLVAISCYSSFYYLNTLEIAFIIKYSINPDCIIVVGGPHPSIIPNDFNPINIPKFFYEFYPDNIIPFNYIIREEAEIGFFKLICSLLKNNSVERSSSTHKFRTLTSDLIIDLDKIPVIDFSLYEKYKEKINKLGFINIDFCRGCMFHCSFCINSTDFMNCYKKVRLKNINLCIEEIKVVNDTKWLSINDIHIMDPIFFPNRSYRNKFYLKLKQFKHETDGFPDKIRVFDRIDLCSEKDLENYKDLNIIPEIGLESISKTTLTNMNKLKTLDDKSIINYTNKVRKIIEISNNLKHEVNFNYIFGFPGSLKDEYNDFDNFFFKNNQRIHSLMENFNINIVWTLYAAIPRSKIYNECESKFGAKIFYKNWWRMPKDNQRELCKLIKPSSNLTFAETINLAEKYFKKIYFFQQKRGNRFYSKNYYSFYKSHLKQLRDEYSDILFTQ